MCLEQHAKTTHNQHVDADDAGSKRTVDKRAVDDDVDIPQLVAQNRDAHRERDEEREEGEDGTTKLGEEHEEDESRMTD